MASVVDVVYRGNAVEFTASFDDADGFPVMPSAVTLTIDYLDASDARAYVSITMAPVTDGWFGSWTTSVANPGQVDWSIKSSDPPIAIDGQFKLRGNRGNLRT